MSRHDKTIDYPDLYIRIPSALESLFQTFIDEFVDSHLYVEVTPKLKDGTLLINSTDLIAFTGYIAQSQLSELDIFRFKSASIKQLEQQLVKSLSLTTQAHYKWCLAQFKNLDFGRFREDDEPEERDETEATIKNSAEEESEN